MIMGGTYSTYCGNRASCTNGREAIHIRKSPGIYIPSSKDKRRQRTVDIEKSGEGKLERWERKIF